MLWGHVWSSFMTFVYREQTHKVCFHPNYRPPQAGQF